MANKRFYLFPLTLLYGLTVRIKNFAYSIHLFRETTFSNVAVIGVGNLSTGGTGKSPMVEYIVNNYSHRYKIAILSRGYGRKTKGYRVCKPTDTYQEIGDEPLQFVSKFNNVVVAVSENRRDGINKIMKEFPNIQMIILDDSFQHRRVKPHLNILLTNYYDLYYKDFLLPTGNLREHISNAKRANIIIVSKCDKILSPIIERQVKEELNPEPTQTLLFSSVSFCGIQPVPNSKAELSPISISDEKHYKAICFAGIAHNYLFVNKARSLFSEIEFIEFKDHHEYSENDLKKIKEIYDNHYSSKKIILTTEKDMRRMQTPELIPILKDMVIYYIPIETIFCNEGATVFNKEIEKLMSKST